MAEIRVAIRDARLGLRNVSDQAWRWVGKKGDQHPRAAKVAKGGTIVVGGVVGAMVEMVGSGEFCYRGDTFAGLTTAGAAVASGVVLATSQRIALAEDRGGQKAAVAAREEVAKVKAAGEEALTAEKAAKVAAEGEAAMVKAELTKAQEEVVGVNQELADAVGQLSEASEGLHLTQQELDSTRKELGHLYGQVRRLVQYVLENVSFFPATIQSGVRGFALKLRRLAASYQLAKVDLTQRYEFVQELTDGGTDVGEGGFGFALKCREKKTGRVVAIKFLSEAMFRNDEAYLRFVDIEAPSLDKLRAEQHENIAAIVEYGQVDTFVSWGKAAIPKGRPFIVTDFVEGQRLDQKMKAGPVQLAEAVAIGRQTLSALACCHKNGIVHRDIKPGNLILQEDGTLKLIDFGIARLIHEGATQAHVDMHTKTGFMMGTPYYMSPEHVLDASSAGPSADVFAAGVILFEMITGKRPISSISNQHQYLARVGTLAPNTTVFIDAVDRAAQLQQQTELALLLKEMLSFQPRTRPEALVALKRLSGLKLEKADTLQDVPADGDRTIVEPMEAAGTFAVSADSIARMTGPHKPAQSGRTKAFGSGQGVKVEDLKKGGEE